MPRSLRDHKLRAGPLDQGLSKDPEELDMANRAVQEAHLTVTIGDQRGLPRALNLALTSKPLGRLELRPVRNALVMPDPFLHKSLPSGYPHGSSGHGSGACELGRMSDKLPVSCPSPDEAKARNAEALAVPVDRERDKISLTRGHCRPMSCESAASGAMGHNFVAGGAARVTVLIFSSICP